MRIVFLGSPEFALPSLEALVAGPHEVVAVVTQPDRPSGRGHSLRPPPVKEAALHHGLPVLQPERVSGTESRAEIESLQPDLLVVAAYGQILSQRLLDVPKRGALNVHPSLLPRWRGASPVAAAILAGDELTGVTIMELVHALDAGPMVARHEVAISPHDTTGTLEARLAQQGADLLARSIDPWASRELTPLPQDESLAMYAPQIQRQEGRIDWSRPAVEIWRRVRAYNPWPAAFTTWHGEELKVWQAWPLQGDGTKAPGTVLGLERLPDEAEERTEALAVQTGAGRLALRSVQRAGRKATTGAEFLRGQRDLIDTRLGE